MPQTLVKKTRRSRNPFKEKTQKLVTHVTAEDCLLRHRYCVTLAEIRSTMQRQSGGYIGYGMGVGHLVPPTDPYTPKSLLAHCDHPEDGWCRQDLPTSEELQGINDHLQGKDKPPAPEIGKKTLIVRRKRSDPKPVELSKYFCTECQKWHVEDDSSLDGPSSSTPGVIRGTVTGIYKNHMANRRKRGRPATAHKR